MSVTIVGLIIGLLGSLWAERAMRTLFFDVVPSSSQAAAIASTLLIVVALVACLIPAYRATRISPVAALRQGE